LNKPVLGSDAGYFLELQTKTEWSRTLYGFASWCSPQPGWLTLDVGCGPGLLPALFSRLGCTAVGVDLDTDMFKPSPLHPTVIVADVMDLPFSHDTFDLVSASNLLFLLPEPIQALNRLRQLLHAGGKLAMLNPSELLNLQSAREFADENCLQGIARDTLLNWAARAEENKRWTEDETRVLYTKARMKYQGCILKVGPGFGRFSSGITQS
jgi:SAM-dependent methyltransferase